MSDPLYDIVVIGGGVNGCGIARDAAGRGGHVLLLEQGDLASGTSSASTKLIHGGLRYLEHYEFGLVREALTERELLWAIAPHVIHPMRFVLPHVKGLRPRWLLRLGLFLYDHIGGRKALPPTQSINLHTHPAGKPLNSGFGPAFVYSDGWVDDARLVVLNARDAANRGATILTQTRVGKLERDLGGHWLVHCGTKTFRARTVVNAAGPAVLDLVGRAGESTKRQMRLVRGSHIVVPRLFEHPYAYFFQISDGRIFFAIPYQDDFTLIGTTDRDHQGPLSEVKASDEEKQYLCDAANAYFAKSITIADIVWSYSGVRPLMDDGSGKPEAATRGYSFDVDLNDHGNAPFVSVFGGKITTYRHLAKDAVEKLLPYLTHLSTKDWTSQESLPGGDFPMQGIEGLKADLFHRYSFLDARSLDRVTRAYGTCAKIWLGHAASWADLGQNFGHGLTQREVDYLMAQEWAVTAEDVLWRRSKLGLRLDAEQVQTLERYMLEQQMGRAE